MVIVGSLLLAPVDLRAETASVIANSRSIFLDSFAGEAPGLGPVRTHVTTFDGQAGFPLYQSLPNGSIIYSGELRPRFGQNGTYEADYVTYDSLGFWRDHGTFSASLPTTDSDGNGLADVAQKNKTGNAPFSGTVVSDFGTVFSVNGSLTRAANSTAGSFSVTLTTPGYPPITHNGNLYLLTVSGAATYSRLSGEISFSLIETLPYGGTRTLTGTGRFGVPNANQIAVQQFTVQSNDGFVYTILPMTLNRTGNRYLGNLRLADGNPDTYWQDYINWVVEVTDPNDTNGNGIPNLTDLASPSAVPADYDGDGKTDRALFLSGEWRINQTSDGLVRTVRFGVSGDLARPSDFDGDGKADIAVFRPSNATWYYIRSINGQSIAVQFGANGDVPLLADFDGDAKSDLAVFRPGTGSWYYRRSSDGQPRSMRYGFNTDLPVPADYDGDGRSDIAVWRPSNGTWYYIKSSNGQSVTMPFGKNGDIPLLANFDNDTKSDLTVYRPANGVWYYLRSTGGPYQSVQYGLNGDIPVPGDYDVDSFSDIAVFRPTNITWYIR